MELPTMARMLRERLGEAASRVPTRTLPNWVVRLLAPVNPTLRAHLEMGLRVAGRTRISLVTSAAVLDEAQAWGGIGRRVGGEAARDALRRLTAGMKLATEWLPDTDPAIVEFVLARVRHLLGSLRQAVEGRLLT